MNKLLFATLALGLLCQCNSVNVTGGAPNPPVTKLAIVKNDKTFMEEMEPEIVNQVREMGIETTVVDAPPPGDGYVMTYTANWAWDMAMYLRYFKADLHRGPTRVGSVEYRTSGYDMNKFGRTASKVRPLLRQLILGEAPTE